MSTNQYSILLEYISFYLVTYDLIFLVSNKKIEPIKFLQKFTVLGLVIPLFAAYIVIFILKISLKNAHSLMDFIWLLILALLFLLIPWGLLSILVKSNENRKPYLLIIGAYLFTLSKLIAFKPE